MKPPVDWNLCQQEHNWARESSVVYQNSWFCTNCGIRVFEISKNG